MLLSLGVFIVSVIYSSNLNRYSIVAESIIILVAVSRLICSFPDIYKTHTGMEPIKHAQRGSHVTKNSPKDFAIVVVSQVVNPRVLYGECLEDPR